MRTNTVAQLDVLQCEILKQLYMRDKIDNEKVAELLREFHHLVYNWDAVGSDSKDSKRLFISFLREARKDFREECRKCEKSKYWI